MVLQANPQILNASQFAFPQNKNIPSHRVERCQISLISLRIA
jgi:hypothetical protein